MLALLALALALAAPRTVPGCQLPLPAGRPFEAGERLAFVVEAMGMSERDGLVLAVDRAGGDALTLSARARFGAVVRRFRGDATSELDAGSLRPRRYHDSSDGGTSSSTDADLLRPGLAQRVHWKVGRKTGMTPYLKSGRTLDGVSAIYHLRAADLRPGQPFCFEAVGASGYWRVQGRAGGTEEVTTPAGRYRALRLEARLDRLGQHPTSVPMTLWLSEDAARLPVAAVLDSPIGAVRARLSSARPGAVPGPHPAFDRTL